MSVLMQTMKDKLINKDKFMTIRLLFDSGSQQSYLRKGVIEFMAEYKLVIEEVMTHNLFMEIKHIKNYEMYVRK